MKLGIVASNAISPSSFYRAFGALTYLAREHSIELMVSEVWDWARLMYCDALFMHCPMSREHVALAELARQTRTPVWVDHDDLVTSLGRDNSGYSSIMRPDVQRNIRRCMELAAVVTVSTPELEKRLWPGATVVPNAVNDYLAGKAEIGKAESRNPEPDKERKSCPVGRKVVTWRGGPAHYSDQETFGPAVGLAARLHPDWEFHFLGCAHWSLEGLMPKGSLVVHEWQDVLSYAEVLRELKPAIHIVPMVPTAFNLCKSNCAWLEATAAGAVTLAPAWGEWMRPGIVHYAGKGEFNAETQRAQRDAEGVNNFVNNFERALGAVLGADSDVLGRAVQESRGFIEGHLLLSKVNEQRMAVLRDITAKGRKNKHE